MAGMNMLCRLCAHHIGFFFQPFVIVDVYACFKLHRRLYPALLLLYDVPGFMWQVLFLAGCEMDIRALGIGMGL